MKNVTLKSDKMSYTDFVAYSLIRYSETHPAFLAWFLNVLATLPYEDGFEETHVNTVPVSTIPSEGMAVRKVWWLVDTLQNSHDEEARKTRALLSSWKENKTQEEHSFIIMGLDYGVMNYGIIGHPKRFHEPLDIVLRTDIVQAVDTQTLVQHAYTLGLTIFERGLVNAQGKVEKLEPELHDWFFGEKKVALHTCPKTALPKLLQEVEDLGAPAVHLSDEQGVTMLAVTPAVYIHDLQHAPMLCPLKSDDSVPKHKHNFE